jgi:hypothetical protein
MLYPDLKGMKITRAISRMINKRQKSGLVGGRIIIAADSCAEVVTSFADINFSVKAIAENFSDLA